MVVEVPFASAVDPFRETPRVYRSTRGFWRLVNGFASYMPEDYRGDPPSSTPSPAHGASPNCAASAPTTLLSTRTYAEDGADPEAVLRAAENEPAVERVAGDGEMILYRVKPAAGR